MMLISRRSYRMVFIVALSCALELIGSLAHAQVIDGAWELQSYTLNGETMDVAGVLVLNDGAFGMIYTMGSDPETLSGRAHAGTYKVDQNRLTFDVQWWIQKVDNVATKVPPKTAGARMEVHNDKLVLHYDGGSVQSLQRLESQGEPINTGHWALRSIQTGNESTPANGLLVAAEDHYVLVYMADNANGRAYGGVSHNAGLYKNLKVLWSLELGEDGGSVSAGNELAGLKLDQSDGTLEVQDDVGNVLTFNR